jgi:hypothetical protein
MQGGQQTGRALVAAGRILHEVHRIGEPDAKFGPGAVTGASGARVSEGVFRRTQRAQLGLQLVSYARFGIVSVGIFYTDWLLLILGGMLLAAVLANSYFRRLAFSAK